MRAGILVVAAALLVGCTHDFDAFEPTADATDDGGDAEALDAATDASALPDAAGADATTGCDLPPSCASVASACGAQCTQSETSCEAACKNAGCKKTCQDTARACKATCVNDCVACGDATQCHAPAACAAAVP